MSDEVVTAAWDAGLDYAAWVAAATQQQSLWEKLHRDTAIPDWAVTAAGTVPTRRLLVIAADWCTDASSTVPVVARLAETVGWPVRIVDRDAHPALMDRYLTHGARSIPVVIVLEEAGHEVGRWGPRPGVLQAWVKANKPSLTNEAFQLEKRKWYARDRGASTIREVLAAAGATVPAAA